MSVKIPPQFLISAATVTVFLIGVVQAWSQPAATTTTLGTISGGNAVTTVSAGSLVTLIATVVSGTTPVTVGQVNFCDASAKYCTDIHVLGTAQLIQAGPSAGTAVFRLIPGIGSHSYKAVFAGTPKAAKPYATSTSSDVALTVTGKASTTTGINATGTAGNYTLTAAVAGTGSPAPTGTVSFLDTSNANASLGMATLNTSPPGLSIVASNIALTGFSSHPISMAAGDFNGDGILDLALAGGAGTPGILLLGNGDGTFKSAPNPATASGFFVVAGDFNGDGIADLAVLNPCGSSTTCTPETPGTVTVWLGNGDGTFTATSVSPPTGSDPFFILVADFNGDGIADLAVANNTFTMPGSAPPGNPITIFLGNGDGTFRAAASPAVSSTIGSMVAGDFNGDGIPDLAVATGVFAGDPETLTVFLGNGDGTFTPAANPIPGRFNELVTADFNGDGKLDLIGDTQLLLLGNGDGTFTASASPAAGSLGIAVGDFNGDGIADLAVVDQWGDCTVVGDGQVNVLLGKGDGTFTQAASVLNVECGSATVAGNFNGSGIASLAETGLVVSGIPALSVVIGQLTATATATGISPVGTGTHQVQASYSGDSIHGPSISTTTPLTAEQGKPTVTVTPSSPSITTMQPLTVMVAVSGGSGNPTPTGSATLTSGTYTSAATSLSSGSATITVPAGSLATGSDTLTASYSGDANYTGATGTAQITVTNPTFTITGTAVSVAPGATTGNTSTITVTPGGGFAGSVALTAVATTSPSGGTLPPAFSFGSTTPVSITAGTAGTATLTIATTGGTTSTCPSANQTHGVSWLAGGSAVLACILVFGIPAGRRGRRSIIGMLLLLAALGGSGMACGGASRTPCAPVTTPGTTAGTYTITVTGASGALTETGTVTLTVQ